MNHRADVALNATRQGANYALKLFGSDLGVETKGSRLDHVTKADRRSQELISKRITESFPNEEIIGEESGKQKSVSGLKKYWVIDPIDGTSNYVHGLPLWATSVASVVGGDTVTAVTIAPVLSHTYRATDSGAHRDEIPISVSEKNNIKNFTGASILRYGHNRDEEFSALMRSLLLCCGDIRRFGSAQLTLGMVACGNLDAAVTIQRNPKPWDTIAGVYLVRKAGGTVTDLDGNRWTPSSNGLIASNGNAHAELVESFHQYFD